jgi:UrcA family protein
MFKVILGAVMLSALVRPAFAAEPAEATRSARVSYADLDLSSAAGVSRLDRRIQSAIQQLCVAQPGTVDLRTKLIDRRCREDAKSSLTAQRHAAIAAARQPALAAR